MSRTSATNVYNYLKHQILNGALEPGSHVREEEVAQAYGCSRTPVREAIRQLDSEGLLELSPHRGARVTSWSEEDIAEIYRVRLLLEGQAAFEAARHIDAADIAKLELLATEMEESALSGKNDRFEVIADLNNRFHSIIHSAARQEMLTAILRGVIQVPMVRNTFSSYTKEELNRSMAHHRELIAALGHHDSKWAESAMSCHIRAARWVTKARTLSNGGAA